MPEADQEAGAPAPAAPTPGTPVAAAPAPQAPAPAGPPRGTFSRLLGFVGFGGARKDRDLSLDAIRGVAILMAVGWHFNRPTGNVVLDALLAPGRTIGWSGVDLFYVLSGFLVGGLLLGELQATGRIQIGRFYSRRAWRLWPSYFLVLLFAWQWFRFVHPVLEGQRMHAPALREMWPFFLQIQNYYDIHTHNKLNIGAAMQTWTMVSIIHFYIILPPLLLLLSKLSGRKGAASVRALPWAVVAISIACFTMRWRAAPWRADDYDAWKNYFPTHLRFDEPMMGVLAAYWVIHARPLVNRVMRCWPVVLLLSIGLLLPIALRTEEGPRFLLIWGYTAGALGCLGLVMIGWWLAQPRADGSVRPAPLAVKCLAQVGLWSYSIYLWHQPLAPLLARKVRDKIFELMTRRHLDPWHSQFQYLASAIVYFSIVLAIGVSMYYLLERPTLLLREKLVPRRAASSIESLLRQPHR